MTRAEHLAWCKTRALAYVDAGDTAGAIASMTSDLTKWSGGPLYDQTLLSVLHLSASLDVGKPERIRAWIEGFN